MTEQKHPGGRPLKFETPEELDTLINLYFDDCDKRVDTRKWAHDETGLDDDGKKICTHCWKRPKTRGCLLISGTLKEPRPYTMTGLAAWLDTTRETLCDYRDRPEFSDSIRRAKQRIENYAEEKLFNADFPTRGVMFSLANNFKDWAEKTDNKTEVSGGLSLTQLFDQAQAGGTIGK